jgi:LysR family transcriptional regulator for metE and metH
LAKKKVVQPGDLSNENYIIYKVEGGDLSNDYFARNILIPKGIQVGKVTKMQLTEARVELVKAGMGLTVLSRWLVKPFTRDSNSVKLLPIGKNGFYRPWYIATLDQKKDDPVVGHFTKFLKEHQLGIA